MIYHDKNLTFNELLGKDDFVSIHHQNLRKLAVEMFKVSKGLSPKINSEIFQFGQGITNELREIKRKTSAP